MIKTKIKFQSYQQQLLNLDEAIVQTQKEEKTMYFEFLQESTIQRFEYCLESSRRLMKTYLIEAYGIESFGPKDTIKIAHEKKLFEDLEARIDMQESRNLTSHTYDEVSANEVYENIISRYKDLLNNLESYFLHVLF